MLSHALPRSISLALSLGIAGIGCSKSAPEPISQAPEMLRATPKPSASTVIPAGDATSGGRSYAAGGRSTAPHGGAPIDGVSSAPPAMPVAAGDDPLHGIFTLADATKSVTGKGDLLATIDTSMGKIECRLFDAKAPKTVANFIGLAMGTRPWKDPSGAWVKKPAYDATKFHRVIPDFMIQGGDARGNGSGEPGYVIADELWAGAKHDRAGLLCMANRGPDTNGAQFFITDKAASHLDASYTIFGECEPIGVVHEIAVAKRDGRDMPLTEITIKSVKISRQSKPIAPKPVATP